MAGLTTFALALSNVVKEYLFLFRLLAIKYRIKYPLRGKEYKVDDDLTTYLEDKICSSFLCLMESAD